MVDLNNAHALCSKLEWNLVKSSFAPLVKNETPLNLKSKIDSLKALHRTYTDMISLLHSESRITKTRKKIELFAETIGRLEAALNNAEVAQGELPPENDDDAKAVIEIPSLGLNAPPDRREARILSPLAQRAEKSGHKSGSSRSQSHVNSIPRRQQGRRNSSKNH
jgi:hypothetical protein